MKHFLTTFLIFAFALLPLSGRAANTAPVTLNVILPMTGGGAFIGQTDQKALKVLEGLVNKDGGIRGRPLQLVFSDDQGNPQNTVQLANQILATKPNAVLGPAIAGLCAAAAPLFNAAKTLLWCYSPTFYPPVGGFVYASLPGSRDLMRVMVRYMKERGIKRLAILSTTDVSGKIGEGDLVDVLKDADRRGVTLVADEVFAPSDVGVTAQLSKIKAARQMR